MQHSIFLIASLALIIVLAFATSSCSYTKNIRIERTKMSFVKLSKEDKLYYGKSEVSNKAYKAFLKDIQLSDPAKYKVCRVDTAKWAERDPLNRYIEHYVRNYYAHSAFENYPVVNISHNAAKLYCEWLTTKAKGKRLVFRLPTTDEFEQLRQTISIDYSSDSRHYYKEMNFNLIFIEDHSQYTAVVKKCKTQYGKTGAKNQQTRSGIYHIVGNVEEFLENGMSTGGSWFSKPSECAIIHDLDPPDPRVGFRVVAEEIRK